MATFQRYFESIPDELRKGKRYFESIPDELDKGNSKGNLVSEGLWKHLKGILELSQKNFEDISGDFGSNND